MKNLMKKALLVFICLLFSAFSIADDGTNKVKMPDDEIEKRTQALTFIQQTAMEKDAKTKTELIKQLGDLKYEESAEVLMSIIESNSQSPTPVTSFHLKESLISLSKVGDSQYTSRLATAFETAKKNLSGENWYRHVESEFNNALVAINRNSTPEKIMTAEFLEATDMAKGFLGKIQAAIAKVGADSPRGKDYITFLTGVQRSLEESPIQFFGRDEEIRRAFRVLARMKGKVPVFTGEAGVGKTAVAEQIGHMLTVGDIPKGKVFQEELSNAILIQTSASRMSRLAMSDQDNAQAAAIENFVASIETIEKDFEKDIILYIDEAHMLSKAQVNALKSSIEDNKKPIKMILSSTNKESNNALFADPAFERRVEKILLEEFDVDQTVKVLKQSWIPVIEDKYNVRYNDDLIYEIVSISKKYKPNVARPSGPFSLLQDFAILAHDKADGELVELTQDDLYKFLSRISGLPVVPQDRENFIKYIEEVKVRLKNKIKGQEVMIDAFVDNFATSLLKQEGKTHRSGVLLGPTGVGKSYLGEEVAKEFFQTDSRTLVIDMNDYQDSTYSLNKLFGAPNGIISSNEDKGLICEFLDGRGQGGGVIILNEIEKGDPGVFNRLMEFLETGKVIGGDTRTRYMGYHYVVMTSNNKIDAILSPEKIKGMTREQLNREIKRVTSKQLKATFTQQKYTQKNKAIPKEVLERIPDWYLASYILPPEAEEIARLEIDKILKNFKKQNVEIEDSFVKIAALANYDPAVGVRQLKQIEKYVSKGVMEHLKKHGKQKGLKISAKTLNEDPSSTIIVIKNSEGKNALEIKGPSVPVDNAFYDKEVRERIQGFKNNISKTLIGQGDIINKMDDLITAQAGNPSKKSITGALLLGTTGTGKTELGKQTAQYRFGSSDMHVVMDMGDVLSSIDMQNKLSPPKGIVGSDEPGELERFLMKYNEGVIIWDEITNMGGNNKAEKNARFKQLYSILDEGVWTNPSGVEYKLNKYIHIFTGNDGEEFFHGLTDDKLLLNKWEQVSKNPETIKNLLVDKGVPPAFLNRVDFTAVMKPTVMDDKENITKVLFNKWQRSFQKAQPAISVELSDDFLETVSRLRYVNTEGGRSVRRFIENNMSAIATKAAMKLDFKKLVNERAQLKFSIEVEEPKNPFFKPGKEMKPKALVHVDVYQNGKKVADMSADVSKGSQFLRQFPVEEAFATAFHEAGHAVVNVPKYTGLVIDYVSISPTQSGALGYALYVPLETHTNMSKETLIMNIAKSYAGEEVEKKLGRNINTGASQDKQQVRQMIEEYVVKAGLIEDLDNARVDKEGRLILSGQQSKKLSDFTKKVTDKGRELSRQIIDKRWDHIQLVAYDLMKNTVIDKERFAELGKMIDDEKTFEAILKNDKTYQELKKFAPTPVGKEKEIKYDDFDNIDCDTLLK
jgi:ATP-dependent Clp protease ATP-binding subunit ClpA